MLTSYQVLTNVQSRKVAAPHPKKPGGTTWIRIVISGPGEHFCSKLFFCFFFGPVFPAASGSQLRSLGSCGKVVSASEV